MQSMSAAMKLMEQHGVHIGPEEERRLAGLTEATSDVLFKQGKVYTQQPGPEVFPFVDFLNHDVLFKEGKVYTYAYKTRSLVEGDHSNLNRDPVQKDTAVPKQTVEVSGGGLQIHATVLVRVVGEECDAAPRRCRSWG